MKRVLSAGLRRRRWLCCMPAAAGSAAAQDIKIGTIYDLTGPFAGGGSKPASIGNKIAIDMINEKGGVEGHKIVADRGRRAIQDRRRHQRGRAAAERGQGRPADGRLLERAMRAAGRQGRRRQEVPLDERLRVLGRVQGQEPDLRLPPDHPLRPVRRCHLLLSSPRTPKQVRQGAKDIKVAIIHEDGPYGVGVAAASEERCKALGMQVVHKEGYSATATDLSALVTKLRRAQPDIIVHAGYNPDITLFLRQAKEAGLKFMALIGEGAGYGQIDKLRRDLQGRRELFPQRRSGRRRSCSIQRPCKPGVGDITAEMVKRYKAETGAAEVPPHVSMGFNQAWIFLTDVLPRAIKKYGGWDPEALRKAALDTDIPLGGTIQGYGVKFFPPGHKMAGQNERSTPVVMQYVDGQTKIAWPTAIRTIDPVLPLPKGHAYAR